MKLSDYHIGSDSPISVLMMGATGTGKSIAACSFPPPIYCANFDGRMGSVANYYRARPGLGVDTDKIEFDIFQDFGYFVDKLDELERSCPYKTLVLDPLTKLCNRIMSYTIGQRRAKKIAGKQRGKIVFSMPEDYGAEISAMRQIMDNLEIIKHQQGVNVILTAHIVTINYSSNNKIKTEEGETVGAEQKTERLIITEGRKLAPQIPLTFDEVYNFYVETGFGNVAYKIRTYNDGDTIARTSFAGVPGEIEWTNEHFFNLIKPFFTEKKPEEVIMQEKVENLVAPVTETF